MPVRKYIYVDSVLGENIQINLNVGLLCYGYKTGTWY